MVYQLPARNGVVRFVSGYDNADNGDADNNGYASAPGTTTSVSNLSLPISIAAGGSLYLAWNFSVTSGSTTSNAQGLGVDNISIFAAGDPVPEPGALISLCGGMGILAMLRRRRA